MYVCVFNIQQCTLSKTKREEKKNCLAKGVAITEQPFREKWLDFTPCTKTSVTDENAI